MRDTRSERCHESDDEHGLRYALYEVRSHTVPHRKQREHESGQKQPESSAQ
jgi:hypothetical protein